MPVGDVIRWSVLAACVAVIGGAGHWLSVRAHAAIQPPPPPATPAPPGPPVRSVTLPARVHVPSVEQALRPENQAIFRALREKRGRLSVTSRPVTEVLNEIGRQLGAPVHLCRDVEPPDRTMSLALPEMSCEALLRQVISELSGRDLPIDFYVADGGVWVQTGNRVRGLVFVLLYDLSDLVDHSVRPRKGLTAKDAAWVLCEKGIDQWYEAQEESGDTGLDRVLAYIPPFAGLTRPDAPDSGSIFGVSDPDAPFSAWQGPGSDRVSEAMDFYRRCLLDLVLTDTWREVGGSATMGPVRGTQLLVLQTSVGHVEITSVLNALRRRSGLPPRQPHVVESLPPEHAVP